MLWVMLCRCFVYRLVRLMKVVFLSGEFVVRLMWLLISMGWFGF